MSWEDILKAELDIPDVVQFDTSALSDKCCNDARTELKRQDEEYFLDPKGAESQYLTQQERLKLLEEGHLKMDKLNCDELKEALKKDIKYRESINMNSPMNRLFKERESSFNAHTKRLREILEEWKECEKRD